MKSKFSIIHFLLLFILSLFADPLFGGTIRPEFEHLSIDEGLSQSTVTSILQDHMGFMWFGTRDGLNKYDGYEFIVYKHQSKNSNSISHNYITSILEDKSGNLWIGTHGGGLNVLNRENNCFQSYRFSDTDSTGLSNNFIWALCEDKQQFLWIGTSYGLNYFDINTRSFTPLKKIHPDLEFFINRSISAIFNDHFGHIWISTNSGDLVKYDRSRQTITSYTHLLTRKSGNPHFIRIIFEDSDGNVWFGTSGGGLLCYDRRTKSFSRYVNKANDPGSIGDNTIFAILEDHAKNLWIGTENGGLSLMRKGTRTFTCYTHAAGDPGSLSNQSVWSLYEDRTHNIWVGTFNGGINLYNPCRRKFIHYRHDPLKRNGLNGNSVLAICGNKGQNIWIGLDGGGLDRFDRRKKQFVHHVHNPRNANSLSHNSVLCVHQDSQGIIWAGTYTGGLNQYEPKNGKFKHFKHDPLDSNSLSWDDVRAIFEDSRGYLWIGTEGGGVNLFERTNGTFRHFRSGSPPDHLSHDSIRTIFEDHEGLIWIGTFGGGLNVYDRDKEIFQYYRYNMNDNLSLSHDDVRSIVEDDEGRLWIGTFGGGLNRFNRENKTFTVYREDQGLANNAICGILIDDNGFLWISTTKGLSKFDPVREVFRNYTVDDGLQSNEFNSSSCYKSITGEMFFGGVNGFNTFHPDSIKDNNFVPPIVFTDFQVFNKSIASTCKNSPISKYINMVEEVQLSYKQNVFSIKFSALNYIAPAKNRYQYKLEGFDKTWNDAGAKRSATYTNLNPGEYVFRVKGSNNDGVWNENGASLRIVIKPPLWRTMWFQICVSIILIYFLYKIISRKMNAIQKKREELEQLIEERTHELTRANRELEQQKTSIHNYAGALKESNEELEWFAHVVSHNLQEPLRMVASYGGLIEKRLKEKLDADSAEYIVHMKNGAARMNTLINDLLTYSSISSHGKPMMKKDLNQLMDQVFLNLKVPIEERRARITYSNLPAVMCDEIQFERLFQNLIDNAIKFCHKKPVIQISSQMENGEWIISVKDNGIGIDLKYSKRIFGVFYRLHNTDEYPGNGIGLAECKKIVERHGGKIWVHSEIDKGSTFFISLPVLIPSAKESQEKEE